MKVIFKILILLIGGSVSSQAQLVQRNLFQRFSEAYIKESLIASAQWHPFPRSADEWHQLLPDSIIQQYIINGEKNLQEEFPTLSATSFLQFSRTKNRSQYEALYSARRLQLFNLVMAESMEGKGRFNDKIADDVWSICEESFWGIPAHIPGLANVDSPYVDLFAAETASLLSWTYYFLGDNLDKISKQLKPRIVSEVKRRMLDPMQTATWWWIGNTNPDTRLNNWSPWIMSNYITAALILETDETKRAAAIKRGLNTIDQYLNGLGNDGAINEGPIYWFASVGCVFDVLSLLHSATAGKINLYTEPFLKKTASYIYQMHIADKYFVNIGDATAQMKVDGPTLYRFGKDISDSNLMAFGTEAARSVASVANDPTDRMLSRRFFNLISMKECFKYQQKYTGPESVWMPDIQMMCSRSNNGIFVASHGGHNGESHNHNDVGDFIIYVNGKPLLVDAGRGTYTGRTFSDERYKLWFNTSAYHNLPEVNGVQQKEGEQFTAKDIQYINNDKLASVSMNMAAAYPSEAQIRNWKRTVTLYKKGSLEIKDDYLLNKSLPVSQHLMTVCKPDISRPGVIAFILADDTRVNLLYDANIWNIEKTPVVLKEPEDEEIRKVWNEQTIMRITLTSKKPLTRNKTTLKLQKANSY